MDTVDRAAGPPPEGITRQRCEDCKRFTRLLPNETRCASCAGVLGLDFRTVRGAR